MIEPVPSDLIHGGVFGYKLLVNDSGGHSYVLYSFGADGVDNAGRADPEVGENKTYRFDDGFDVPLNY